MALYKYVYHYYYYYYYYYYYIPDFIEVEETFCGQTYGRTDGRTDI